MAIKTRITEMLGRDHAFWPGLKMDIANLFMRAAPISTSGPRYKGKKT